MIGFIGKVRIVNILLKIVRPSVFEDERVVGFGANFQVLGASFFVVKIVQEVVFRLNFKIIKMKVSIKIASFVFHIFKV